MNQNELIWKRWRKKLPLLAREHRKWVTHNRKSCCSQKSRPKKFPSSFRVAPRALTPTRNFSPVATTSPWWSSLLITLATGNMLRSAGTPRLSKKPHLSSPSPLPTRAAPCTASLRQNAWTSPWKSWGFNTPHSWKQFPIKTWEFLRKKPTTNYRSLKNYLYFCRGKNGNKKQCYENKRRDIYYHW